MAFSPPRSAAPSEGALSPSRYYGRVFGLATACVLGYFLWRILTPLATSLMWAFLIAYLLQPLNRKLLARWHKPGLAAGVLTGAAFVVIAGPLTLFVFAFLRQAGDLLTRFQTEASDRNLPALQLVLEFKPVQMMLGKAGDFTALSKEQILSSTYEAAQGALQRVAAVGGSLVVGAVNIITEFSLTMFVLFFFLRDGRNMLERGIRLVPMRPKQKQDLAQTLGGVTRAVVLGTLVTALVQGTLLGIGFAISGLPSPLVFGAIGAMASLIPFVGTALVWVPAAISLFAQGQTGWAIFLALWGTILVGGSDNVVRPLIISGSSNASTLLVFLGLLGGISFFNIAGIFMGPLVLTLAASLLKYADSELPRVSLFSGAPPSAPTPTILGPTGAPTSEPPIAPAGG